MDYQAFNDVLDKIEEKLKGIKSNFNLRANIERWRWDQPEIRMTWRDTDGVNKNINILLESLFLRGKPYVKGVVEVNAWIDKKPQDGWKRFWTNKPMVNGRIDLKTDAQILDAYYNANDLNEDSLNESYEMSEQAARILENLAVSPNP